MTRILSISGLRGIIGDGLDPEYIVRFAAAVGTLAQRAAGDQQPLVVVSRDGRATGEMVKHAAISGLLATGCRILDLDIATTPTAGVNVHHHAAHYGLQITASHNPSEWNGLKPFGPDGSVFNAERGKELLALLESGDFAYVDHSRVGSVELVADPAAPHIDRTLKLVDVPAINKRRFKVVLDCNRGSGAVSTPQLLERLGCDYIILGDKPDGHFDHTPEPIAENLTTLCDAVRAHKADAGFAQDPDADRLAIVDNKGRYIGEELTLALAVDHVLATRKGPVVVNGSTSRVTADLAEKHGCEFHRSYVGEAHVTAKMREVNATIGGEGNGGVIEPAVGFVRDSYVSIAYVLDGLVQRGGTLAEWADSLPKYEIVKSKLTCPREKVDAAVVALKEAYADATASEGDGLRLDWDDRWVQVRASNTEPILRVIAEAPDAATGQQLCEDAMEKVKAAVT